MTAKLLLPTPKRLHIGVFDSGKPTSVGLAETNLLIAGQPGSGKSGTIASIYAQLSQLPNVATLNFDPKMVELGAWEERSTFNSVCDRCFPFALQAVYEEMERRYYIMKKRGWKKITPDYWWEFPQLVLVLDELAKVFSDPDNPITSPQKSFNYAVARKLVAEGRAAGISVITATQRPSADLVPTSLRNLIQQRIVHSMARETDTKMVLGDVNGTTAHELSPAEKGVGFILNEGSRIPQRFRASWILNNEERETAAKSSDPLVRHIADAYPTIEEIVEATSCLRVELPFLEDNEGLQNHLNWHKGEERRLALKYGL